MCLSDGSHWPATTAEYQKKKKKACQLDTRGTERTAAHDIKYPQLPRYSYSQSVNGIYSILQSNDTFSPIYINDAV